MDGRFVATVIRSTGSWYELRRDDGGPDISGSIFKARVRGRLRLGGARSTNPVVVGDRVECSMEEGGMCSGALRGSSLPGRGEVWIERVLPRRNYIIRRSSNLSHESHVIAANIDRALVVATLFSPVTSTEFIDRFLVTCEVYAIPAAILLNKIDLARADAPETVQRFVSVYEGAGYPVMLASALTGEGMELVKDYLYGGGTTLVSGNSGVGKSTLASAVSPGFDIRIGEISQAHGKGMHTTTFSQMYPLECRGDGIRDGSGDGRSYIIDTPGIKGFGLIDIGADELCRYFPEMMRVAPECGYYNCTHTHEPDCAVVRAVEEGAISEERYVSYLKMLEEDGKYRK